MLCAKPAGVNGDMTMTNDTLMPQSGSRFLTRVLRVPTATMVVMASHVCIVTETYAP